MSSPKPNLNQPSSRSSSPQPLSAAEPFSSSSDSEESLLAPFTSAVNIHNTSDPASNLYQSPT